MIPDPRPAGIHRVAVPALDEILKARDERAQLRQVHLQSADVPVVVQLSVAVPAELRQTRKVEVLFLAAVLRFEDSIRASGWSALRHESGQGLLGPWVLWTVTGSAAKPERIKLLCVRIEEDKPSDRILDFDVEIPGRSIDRSFLGMEARCCPVCGGEAALCSGRAIHPRDEVLAAFTGLISGAEPGLGHVSQW